MEDAGWQPAGSQAVQDGGLGYGSLSWPSDHPAWVSSYVLFTVIVFTMFVIVSGSVQAVPGKFGYE
jgi:hypothetical protein